VPRIDKELIIGCKVEVFTKTKLVISLHILFAPVAHSSIAYIGAPAAEFEIPDVIAMKSSGCGGYADLIVIMPPELAIENESSRDLAVVVDIVDSLVAAIGYAPPHKHADPFS
jgi:hypothetical protein